MVAGVTAIIAALLSSTLATFPLLDQYHFPARARRTLINPLAVPSFAYVPVTACVVAPFTAASAAIKNNSENLAIGNGRVVPAFCPPNPVPLSVLYGPSFQSPGYASLLMPLGAITKSALPGITPALALLFPN